MVNFDDLLPVLVHYRKRFRYFDTFVDDIVEFEDGTGQGVYTTPSGSVFFVSVGGRHFRGEIYAKAGFARFSLEPADPSAEGAGEGMGEAAATVIQAGRNAARDAKEGLLGGRVFGLLIGGLTGNPPGAGPDMHHSFTLQFNDSTRSWEFYDGAMMRWARSQLAATHL